MRVSFLKTVLVKTVGYSEYILPHFSPLFNKKRVFFSPSLHFFDVKLPLQRQKNNTDTIYCVCKVYFTLYVHTKVNTELRHSTGSEAPSSSLGWSERRRQQTTGASAHEIVSRGLRPATDDRIWNPPPTPLRRGTSGVCYITRPPFTPIT